MMTLSRKSFAIGLLVAFLVVSTGRAVPVLALADPQPEVWLTPVYDTTIYQFSDYAESLTDPQFEIFKIALGAYVAAQGGANKYDLTDPFTTKDGVIGWFKSLGLTAYNSLIDLVPDTYIDPVTGNVQSTAQSKELVKYAVAYAMGAAVLAANYSTEQDFLDDMENSANMFFHFGPVAQAGINGLVALNGGFYQWQLHPYQYESNFSWVQTTATGTLLSRYNEAVANLPVPRTPANSISTVKGVLFSMPSIVPARFDIFIDTVHNKISIYNLQERYSSVPFVSVINDSRIFASDGYLWTREQGYNPSNFSSYQQLVQYYITQYNYSNCLTYLQLDSNTNAFYNIVPYLGEVRAGSSWENSVLVEALDDLDFALNNIQYYEQLTNDYLFDIRQYILDLINQPHLYQPWIDNLFDLTGLQVPNPPTIKVSIDIDDLLALDILPVNLNDIAEYTDNTYLDRVKEEARKFGDIFAAFIAFWHNVDYDLVYILFGCSITVLVGAFIGKWGHS